MKFVKAATVATAGALGLAVVLGGAAGPAGAIDPQRILEADKNPNDWLTYHKSYKSWHYSALDEINTGNVRNLKVA